MELALWIVAVMFVVAAVVSILRGAWLIGLVLVVLALLVGPGGVSVFT
jgi:hypothetical protein